MRLQGKDRVLLLALMRKLLRWLPEERPSAQDLFEDEFLLQYDVSEKDPEDDGLQEST
jgi:serine/threonine protein kinase